VVVLFDFGVSCLLGLDDGLVEPDTEPGMLDAEEDGYEEVCEEVGGNEGTEPIA